MPPPRHDSSTCFRPLRSRGGPGAVTGETSLLRRGGVVAATLAVAAAFVFFPLVFSNPTTTSIAFFVLIYMIAATAWNVFSGLSGYIALGHAVTTASVAQAERAVETSSVPHITAACPANSFAQNRPP